MTSFVLSDNDFSVLLELHITNNEMQTINQGNKLNINL